jgi:predicted RNA-binding Zn-ribbon protein involved in translation (DUF1610 family)
MLALLPMIGASAIAYNYYKKVQPMFKEYPITITPAKDIKLMTKSEKTSFIIELVHAYVNIAKVTKDLQAYCKELSTNNTKLHYQLNEPLACLLWCPECGKRHIDEGEFATKPHHTHACQACGMTWRPAIQPTTGVQFLPGFKNT